MEQIGAKYSSQAEFLFIYGKEAHPEDPAGLGGKHRADGRPIPQATTTAERQEAARSFRDQRNIRRRILLDSVGSDHYGERLFHDLQNPVLVVDAQGRIAATWDWADADELDLFLSRFLARHHHE